MQNVRSCKRPSESELQSTTCKRQKVETEKVSVVPIDHSADQEIASLRQKLGNVEKKLKQSERLLSSIYDTLSDSNRTDLLNMAFEEDKTEIVEYLLASGMDVNSIDDEYCRSVLHK
eukprot:368558_1